MANKEYEVNVSGLSVLGYGHPVEELNRRGDWSHVSTSINGQPAEGYVAHKYLRQTSGGFGFKLPAFGKPKITLDRLRAFAGRASEDTLEALNDSLDRVLAEFDINKNARRLSHFLAQLSHESAGFTAVEENLNYSADALWNVFRKYFSSEDEAEAFARQPERIANRVYANRMGNGPEESGDGYRYRGRGFIQLTGKNNYARYGSLLGLPLVQNPELAAVPENALKIAAAYWQENGLNKLADDNNLKAITKRINGGYNGLQHRIEEFKKAASIWSAPGAITSDGRPRKDRSGIAATGTGAAGAGAVATSGTDILEGEGKEAVNQRRAEEIFNLPAADEAPSLEEPPAPEPPVPPEQPEPSLPAEDAEPKAPEPEAPEPEAREPEAVEEPVEEPPAAEQPPAPAEVSDEQPPVEAAPEAEAPVEEALPEAPEEAPEEPAEGEEPADAEVPAEAPPPEVEVPAEVPAAPEEPVEVPVPAAPAPEAEAPTPPEEPEEVKPPVAEEPTPEVPAEPVTPPADEPGPAKPTPGTPNMEVVNEGLREAADKENTLEIWSMVLAIVVVVLAIYLIWNRINRE